MDQSVLALSVVVNPLICHYAFRFEKKKFHKINLEKFWWCLYTNFHFTRKCLAKLRLHIIDKYVLYTQFLGNLF